MPTLKEIAREAGVSGALVSYYLNGGGKGRMREETRRRIDEAIRKLKYHPNRLARSLRTGRSRSIGFLAGNIAKGTRKIYNATYKYNGFFGSIRRNLKKSL